MQASFLAHVKLTAGLHGLVEVRETFSICDSGEGIIASGWAIPTVGSASSRKGFAPGRFFYQSIY